MLQNLKIKYQILIPSLIFGAIITSLSLHGMGQLLQVDLKLSFANHLTTVIEERSNRIELYLDLLNAHASGVASDETITACFDHPDSQACSQEQLSAYLLKNKLPNIPNLAELAMLDSHGQLLASSLLNAVRGTDWSSTNEFTQGMQKAYTSDIYQSALTDEYMINVAVPVTANTKLAGIIVGKFRATTLFNITADPSGLETTGDLYLVNKNGIRISPSRFVDNAVMEKTATANLDECLADYKKYGDGVSEVGSHDEKIIPFAGTNGQAMLGTHGYIPGQQWCVMAEMTQAEMMLPLTSLRWIFIVMGLAIMTGITIYSLWLSIHTARPIRHLLSEAKTIVMGHYGHRINSARQDETGQIAHLIDHLAEHTKKDPHTKNEDDAPPL